MAGVFLAAKELPGLLLLRVVDDLFCSAYLVNFTLMTGTQRGLQTLRAKLMSCVTTTMVMLFSLFSEAHGFQHSSPTSSDPGRR